MLELAIVAMLLNDHTNPEAQAEQHCLIENAIYEAHGEGTRGMQLVTEVVVNRVNREYRGEWTYCNVIHDPAQFSWTLEDTPREYSEEEYLEAGQVVLSVLYGELPKVLGENVTHYLNEDEATDLSWYDPNKVVLRHKNHQFLAGVR